MRFVLEYDILNKRTKNLRPNADECFDMHNVSNEVESGVYTREQLNTLATDAIADYDGVGIPVAAMCYAHLSTIIRDNGLTGEVNIDIGKKGIIFEEL